MKDNPSKKKLAWAGPIFYLAITGAHAWYLYGFIPVAGLLFLSLIGGMFLYFGSRKVLRAVFDRPSGVGSFIGGLFLLVLGMLTLIPGWPDDLLVESSIGWFILEERGRLLDQAMYDDNLLLIQKISWAGLGDPEPRDSFGHPLIDDAKNPEILHMLLKSGLNPDARDEGGTTLLMRTSDQEMAEVLLAAGANPNARNDEGRTPLMYVRDANIELMKLLAENGAEINAVDDFGRSVGDWLGTSPAIDNVLAQYTPDGILRNTDLDFLSHARRDWLDQEQLENENLLTPSTISADPVSMTHGDLAELQIRLSNDSDTDRVLKVEASLNTAAFFVSSSHNGKIINPYQAQLEQEISWPLLSLPAHSSGVLNMNIMARDDWDAGDLSINVSARNILTYADEETIHLNLYQPLSDDAYTESSLLISFLGALVIPLPFLIWLGAWRFLGKKHPFTKGIGRLIAVMFSLICFLGASSMTRDLVRPYLSYEESEALILDRRYYLDHTTSTDSRGRTSSRLIHVPILAAQYSTTNGEVVSTGPASDQFFRETKLGDTVPCWYDPDDPRRFTVVREFSFITVFAICFMAIMSLALVWVAFWKRRESESAQ